MAGLTISKKALTSRAKQRLLDLLDSPNDHVALMAALEIMDRAYGPTDRRSSSEFDELSDLAALTEGGAFKRH